jgi:hypothetical protein
MTWAAIGAIAMYNVLCWIPASFPVIAIAACAGSLFLLASRPIWRGAAVVILSLIVGFLTSQILPGWYQYYFVAFTLMMVTIPAAIMATGIRRGISVYRIQLWALAPVTALVLLFMADALNALTYWKGALDSMREVTIDWFDAAIATSPGTPAPENVSEFRQMLASTFDFVYRFTPALLITWAAVTNVAAYYLACRMIRLKGGFCRQLVAFSLWKASLTHMILLALAMVIRMTAIDLLKPASENLLLVLVILYMVVGLSVVEYYLKRYRIHAALRTAVVIMLVFSGWVGGLLAAAVGLIDSHFDFRRVRAQQIG